MSTLQLLISELRYRWVNFAMILLAVTAAATLFVTGPTIVSGFAADTQSRLELMQNEADQRVEELNKKTRRIMRDLGVNLRIVHKKTNLGSLYTDFAAYDFPEEYVNRLATAPQIETIVHLLATLQHKTKWRDRTVLVVGVLPVLTESQKNEEKPHMIKHVKPGTVHVGHELGVGIQVGDTIEIHGQPFQVAQIHDEYGGLQDVQLVLHLHDAQRVLDKPGMINQIMALNCKCKGDRLSVIRAELEGVLPDTQVTEHRTLATAREQQRDLVEKDAARQIEVVKQNRDETQHSMSVLFGVLTPTVVFVSSLFICVLTFLNVRERCAEIGVLRALGKGGFSIASLFLLRAAFTGLVGGGLAGVICCLIPVVSSSLNGLPIASEHLRPSLPLLALTLLGAPLVSAMASYLPALAAIRQDPATVLMDP